MLWQAQDQVEDVRASLLKTRIDVSAAARTLELEELREPTTKQQRRNLSIQGTAVVARRGTFLDDNAAATTATTAHASEIADARVRTKGSADAAAAAVEVARSADALKAKNTAAAAKAARMLPKPPAPPAPPSPRPP